MDLDRHFVPLANDKDATLEWGPHWGRKYGGWLGWPELLTRRRVVLLAEALSGKTRELEHRVKCLKGDGRAAFFVRIEDLADRGFLVALDDEDVGLFRAWKASSSGDAWFFLDSVDEARLNGKRFSSALETFRKELGRDNLNRAFVVVSCRASDWRGKSDRDALQTELPFEDVEHATAPMADAEEVLLSPLFNAEKHQSRNSRQKEPRVKPRELSVVQLAPLSGDQMAQMADAAGLDGQAFRRAIELAGLETMAERPGDLIDLIGYWAAHKAFGSLLTMTEESIRRKLREEDVYRPEAAILSPEKARQGAERVAAALVLGKTFSLKAPGQDADPALSPGAIDASSVLVDWDQKSVNALLRTGLFAPSTYGRVKFHHRSTQEYLAACWLRSLLEENCPQHEIHRLLFVEPYGVKTVVPTLLAVCAWLSHWIPSFRDELINREPVALMVHGDPKSLPIEVRGALLDSYASLDATGQLDAENVDYRAAWMFSDPQLAADITRAWNKNERSNFRLHLLQIIEEGRVKRCVPLARRVALDHAQDQYLRLVGARALVACEDVSGLQALAKQVRSEPDRLSARLAPEFALALYPRYLSTADLLQLIDRSRVAKPFSSEGFASHLAELHNRAPTRTAQLQLVQGIAELVLPSLKIDEVDDSNNRHAELCSGIAKLALTELAQCESGEIPHGVLRLLMAVERAPRASGDSDDIDALAKWVRADKALNRQLMWADAGTTRTGNIKQTLPVRVFQIGPHMGRTLWATNVTDVEWLIKDASRKANEHERRIAFSAVYLALLANNQVENCPLAFDELLSNDPALQNDFTEYTTPRKPEEWELTHAEFERKREFENSAAKQSWRNLRTSLIACPELLDKEEALSSWKSGLHRLHHLTKWVRLTAAQREMEGMSSWRLLRTAFSNEVAEHYANGMRLVWRRIKPERPLVKVDGTYTTKHVSVLAIDALELESAEPGWPSKLTDAEARMAIRHAIMAGSIKATWVDQLLHSKGTVVLPEIVSGARLEFRSGGRYSDILMNTAYSETAARSAVAREVFVLLKAKDPVDMTTLQYSLRTIGRCIGELPREELLALVKTRVSRQLAAGNTDRVLEYLSIQSLLDGEGVARFALALLMRGRSETDDDFSARVKYWLGALFDGFGRSGCAIAALDTMPIEALAQFLRLAYRHAPIADHRPTNGGTRSNHDPAEMARSTLLQHLMNRRGVDAFSAITTLACEPDFVDSRLRFMELAHSKAQTDGDIVPWSADEIVRFTRGYSAPAKNGMQLLRLTIDLVDDITASFNNADASTRALLARAGDEEEVQLWLAERLHERSRGRYHTHRETEVADRNEPDIVVSSSSIDVQVAIEIKNGNMGWTVPQLERAIAHQLAEDYLRTRNRRHGILVISLHKRRTWRVGGEVWDFAQLIAHLQSFAKSIRSNRTGAVEVRVRGVDASEPLLAETLKLRSVNKRTRSVSKRKRSTVLAA
ncbi:hypothetical protein [Paraburkholderia sp. BR14312]|uniref:hypothetical protein n=1 Tax=unclassified Paraburkholderia TaxID=2615204 RepID=UPI0034CEAC4A